MCEIKREEIFKAIDEERERQEKLHPLPRVKKHEDKELEVMANLILSKEYLAVLVEEIGEVGSALQGDGDLHEELIHVAAVCVRWLENIK